MHPATASSDVAARPSSDRPFVLATAGMSLIAAAVHALTLETPPYWLDEVGTAASMQQPLLEMIETRAAKAHQPLYFVTGWFWSKLFGFDAVGLRSLSLLCSVIAALGSGWIGYRVANIRLAALTVLMVMINPIILLFSHLSRPYAMLVMWVVLLMVCAIESQRRKSIGWAIALGATALATLLTHYSGVIAIAAVCLWAVTLGKRGIPILIAAVAACVCWTPWLWWCLQQFRPEDVSNGIPVYDNAYLYVLFTKIANIGQSRPLLLLPPSLLVLGAVCYGAWRAGTIGRLAMMIYIAPLLQAAVLLIFSDKSIFAMERYFGALLAAQTILLAVALYQLNKRGGWLRQTAFVSILAVLMLCFAWRVHRPRRDSSWDRMAAIIEQSGTPTTPVVTFSMDSGFEMAYHLDRPVLRLFPDVAVDQVNTDPESPYKSLPTSPARLITEEHNHFWVALHEREIAKFNNGDPHGSMREQFGNLDEHFEIHEVKTFRSGHLVRLQRKSFESEQ